MITTVRECREFGRMVESHRRQRNGRRVAQAFESIGELVRKGEIKPGDWSVRTLYETLVPGGERHMRELELNQRAGMRRGGVLMEAGDAISTADFSQIIGQINYGTVMQQLDLPSLIGGQLATTRQATTQGIEQIPGVTMLTDQAQEVGEAEDYPVVGVGQQWIVAPRKVKHGFRVEATEEVVYEDKTGLLQQQMSRGAEAMAINEERETLATACGITTGFVYNDNPAQATYADSHTGFTLDNLIANNALVDYTDLDAVEQHFDAIVDPGTGEPVSLTGNLQILHPKALRASVFRVLNATETRQGAIDATTPITITGNPIQSEFYSNYSPLTNQYVKETTGSDSTYFVGQFQKAFERHEIFPTQVFVEDQNTSPARFERDIITRIKVRRKSAMVVVAPWYVVKCTG